MERNYITIQEFCIHHKAEPDFLDALAENGILTFIEVNREKAIQYEHLPELECYIRWHYELDINLEGIDAMRHLVNKIRTLQEENTYLKSQL